MMYLCMLIFLPEARHRPELGVPAKVLI